MFRNPDSMPISWMDVDVDHRRKGRMNRLFDSRWSGKGKGQEPANGAVPLSKSDESFLSRPHTELELSRQDQAGEPPDVL
jgi:hypothetical protein